MAKGQLAWGSRHTGSREQGGQVPSTENATVMTDLKKSSRAREQQLLPLTHQSATQVRRRPNLNSAGPFLISVFGPCLPDASENTVKFEAEWPLRANSVWMTMNNILSRTRRHNATSISCGFYLINIRVNVCVSPPPRSNQTVELCRVQQEPGSVVVKETCSGDLEPQPGPPAVSSAQAFCSCLELVQCCNHMAITVLRRAVWVTRRNSYLYIHISCCTVSLK